MEPIFTVEEYHDPESSRLSVKVWTIYNEQKYEARAFYDLFNSREEFTGLILTLRDGLLARIRRDEEERDLNLTP